MKLTKQEYENLTVWKVGDRDPSKVFRTESYGGVITCIALTGQPGIMNILFEKVEFIEEITPL